MREWLEDRVAYIRGLKSPNDHQRLLLLLNDKKDELTMTAASWSP